MSRSSAAWYPILIALAACGADAPAAPAPAATTIAMVGADGLAERMAPDGKPRVVNLWATWCGPCVAELPELAALARDRDDVDVLLVSMDYPTLARSHVVPFLERHSLQDMEVVVVDDADPARAVTHAVPDWPGAIPFTLVLDADGNRTATFAVSVTRRDVEAALDSASR